MRTKLFALSGAPLHASGGDSSSPACEYFFGIDSPSLNPMDVSVITATALPLPPPRPPPRPRPCGVGGAPPGGFCAPAADAALTTNTIPIANRVMFMAGYLYEAGCNFRHAS